MSTSGRPAAPNTVCHVFVRVGHSVLAISIGRFHQEALAETYRRHGAAVHALAQRVLGSTALADEVTQEVFVELWRRPEQFDANRGTLRTWLLTKTHGRAVDLLRAESSRTRREASSAGDYALAGYDIDHFAWDLAVADQVRNALDVLPGEERRAIEMAYFLGMTYVEVARALGAPEGTVKSRIRNGLRRLRVALTKLGVEAP